LPAVTDIDVEIKGTWAVATLHDVFVRFWLNAGDFRTVCIVSPLLHAVSGIDDSAICW
jgi:hypothetical protein